MRNFLLIPKLVIHQANAMSSPYTIGFPAMTAWLGAVHALQRRLQADGLTHLKLNHVAVSCHSLVLRTYRGEGDFVHSVIGTANPLNEKGERPSFIEEPKCHLKVSLLIELSQDYDPDDKIRLLDLTKKNLHQMKFAGGDVLEWDEKHLGIQSLIENDSKSLRDVLTTLMPGTVLIERRDLMLVQNDQDVLDILIDYLAVHHQCVNDNEEITWVSSRKEKGWIVPIAVGFQAVSPLGQARHQRDPNKLHCFAESMVTLGEFVIPRKIQQIDSILWKYHVDLKKQQYVCKTLQLSL